MTSRPFILQALIGECETVGEAIRQVRGNQQATHTQTDRRDKKTEGEQDKNDRTNTGDGGGKQRPPDSPFNIIMFIPFQLEFVKFRNLSKQCLLISQLYKYESPSVFIVKAINFTSTSD